MPPDRPLKDGKRVQAVANRRKYRGGITLEVPSVVILADQLAAEANLFSIGTNDLARYMLAVQRGNARVA